jgi:PAS domain S-box-containing protein
MPMKINQKLMVGYLAIALVMGTLGYLSIRVYVDIRNEVAELKIDSLDVSGSAENLIRALENSQKSMQDLIDNKPEIFYTYSVSSPETGKSTIKLQQEQIEKRLKENLDNLEYLLTPLIKVTRQGGKVPEDVNLWHGEEKLKDLLDIRKKHFYYHWKYLSHFIKLAEELPVQANAFFKKTLEPHYRANIQPVIQKYWEKKQEEREQQITKIIHKFIPDASLVIIVSTALTLTSILVLGLWVSNSLSRPLRLLTDATSEIGKGQLKTRIDIQTSDEVGILADAFNRMAKDLSKTTVSKTYVDNIIESMQDTLIVINPDTTIRTINQAALDLLGYSDHELIGSPISDILFEENSELASIDAIMYESSLGKVEKKYLTKVGEKVPVTISRAVMHDKHSNIEGIVWVARDISERRHSEKLIQKAYDEMERRVDERTEELVAANQLLKREIIKHERTEVALRQSENRLRSLSSHIISVQEKERRRISMELHDDLGQSLSLLKVQLSSMQNRTGSATTAIFGDLQETRQYLDLVIENVRRLSRDLSPALLEDLGLTAAIGCLLDDFVKHYNFEISREIKTIDKYVPLEKQIILYRIFQEIMTNIAKHASASRVNIQIKLDNDLIAVTVADNGEGFDLEQLSAMHAAEKGMGLAAMQERVLMLGSFLDISTRPGQGTRIHFEIPRREEASV